MVKNEREIRHEIVVEACHQMMTAARTAPKAKGIDIVEIALVSERADLEALAIAMQHRAETSGMKFLLRDADNVLQSEAVVLIGTKRQTLGLNCEYCGAKSCEANPERVPCVFNSVDVGIAIGSACAAAADRRLDTRVMFSVGWSAQDLQWMPEGCSQVLGIVVSASSKSPYFDRKPKE